MNWSSEECKQYQRSAILISDGIFKGLNWNDNLLVAPEQIAVFQYSKFIFLRTDKQKRTSNIQKYPILTQKNEILSLRLSFCCTEKEDLWANLLSNIMYSEHYRFAVILGLLFYMNMLLANQGLSIFDKLRHWLHRNSLGEYWQSTLIDPIKTYAKEC